MLTEKQLHYLETLTVDLQFDLHRRNAHIESIISRKVNHLDELTKREASVVIDKFKGWRDDLTDSAKAENQA